MSDMLCERILCARNQGDLSLWPCRSCDDEHKCNIGRRLMFDGLAEVYPLPWKCSWDRKMAIITDANDKPMLRTALDMDCYDGGGYKKIGIGTAYKINRAVAHFLVGLVNKYANGRGVQYTLTEFYYSESEGESVKTYTGSQAALTAKMEKRFNEVRTRKRNEGAYGNIVTTHRAYLMDEQSGSWRYEWWLRESEEVNG